MERRDLLEKGSHVLQKNHTKVHCTNCGKSWTVFFPSYDQPIREVSNCPGCSKIPNAKVVGG